MIFCVAYLNSQSVRAVIFLSIVNEVINATPFPKSVRRSEQVTALTASPQNTRLIEGDHEYRNELILALSTEDPKEVDRSMRGGIQAKLTLGDDGYPVGDEV